MDFEDKRERDTYLFLEYAAEYMPKFAESFFEENSWSKRERIADQAINFYEQLVKRKFDKLGLIATDFKIIKSNPISENYRDFMDIGEGSRALVSIFERIKGGIEDSKINGIVSDEIDLTSLDIIDFVAIWVRAWAPSKSKRSDGIEENILNKYIEKFLVLPSRRKLS